MTEPIETGKATKKRPTKKQIIIGVIVGLLLLGLIAGLTTSGKNKEEAKQETTKTQPTEKAETKPSEDLSAVSTYTSDMGALCDKFVVVLTDNVEHSTTLSIDPYNQTAKTALLDNAAKIMRLSEEGKALVAPPQYAASKVLFDQAMNEYKAYCEDLVVAIQEDSAFALDAATSHVEQATRYMRQATEMVQGI